MAVPVANAIAAIGLRLELSEHVRPIASSAQSKENTLTMSNTQSGPSRPSRPTSKNKNTNRAKAAVASAHAQSRFRTRHPVLTALVPVGLVVAAIATMVVIKAAGNSNPAASASASASASSSSHVSSAGSAGSSASASATTDAGTTALSPQVVAALAVPATTLDTVGSPSTVVLPTKTGSSTTLKAADGKPLITYIGAEYCPYCAAERWALAVALSRFGTFENLSGTHSSGSDVYPNTQTLSFYGSSYSSPYVEFQTVEEATNQQEGNSYQPLQTPTAAQTALMAKNDPQGSIPFLDIANRYVITGSSFSPQVLQGLSRSQIAAQLSNPDSVVAQAIDGAANVITAAIASVTGNQPAGVGSSATIAAIQQKLEA